jgi:hypothetical protein
VRVLTWFYFINVWFYKMLPRDELGESHDSVIISRSNAKVFSNALICGLEVYLVEALELVYLVLAQ